MNTGIFYLYEYSNAQKLRNAGFLKITRHYHSCTLQLHARGIPVARTDLLKLCAFYLENGIAKSSVLAEITCESHAVSARLNSAESQFPDGRPLPHIDGFLLPLPNGTVLAAAASDAGFNTSRIQFVSPNMQKEEETANVKQDAEEIHVSPSLPETQETKTFSPPPDTQAIETLSTLPKAQESEISTSISDIPETAVPAEAGSFPAKSGEPEATASVTPLKMQQSNAASAAPLKTRQDNETSAASLKMQQYEEAAPAEHTASDSPQENIRKIQRSELSGLPRRYWSLANNSFLMHGYHNYNHLLLIEEDGHYWLGVPGIYDARESRAAELFGFPQFTDSYNEKLSLSEEECNLDETFGYWCRYLK